MYRLNIFDWTGNLLNISVYIFSVGFSGFITFGNFDIDLNGSGGGYYSLSIFFYWTVVLVSFFHVYYGCDSGFAEVFVHHFSGKS